MTSATLIVHALDAGLPLCLFMAGQTPSAWPPNHRWVGVADTPAFAPEAAEPCPVCEKLVRERFERPLLLDDRDDSVVLEPRSIDSLFDGPDVISSARERTPTTHPPGRPGPRAMPAVDMSLVAFEKCELCETPLVMRYPDGKKIRFTAHTPEYCRLSTLSRIKILTEMWQRDKLDHEAWRRSLDDVFRRYDVMNRRPPVEMVQGWIDRLKNKATELRSLADDRDPVYPLLIAALTEIARDIEADLNR